MSFHRRDEGRRLRRRRPNGNANAKARNITQKDIAEHTKALNACLMNEDETPDNGGGHTGEAEEGC